MQHKFSIILNSLTLAESLSASGSSHYRAIVTIVTVQGQSSHVVVLKICRQPCVAASFRGRRDLQAVQSDQV